MSTKGSIPLIFPSQPFNGEQVNALVTVSTECPATHDQADVMRIGSEAGVPIGELRDLWCIDADITDAVIIEHLMHHSDVEITRANYSAIKNTNGGK
jgi:hypothetical protein